MLSLPGGMREALRIKSAGPSIEGPPGCEESAESCILYLMYSCILALISVYSCILYAGCCILDPGCSHLDVGVWPGKWDFTFHFPGDQDSGPTLRITPKP